MANYQLTYTGSELQTILDSVSDKVDKVTGKGLSTNDFTNAYKANVDVLSQISKTIYVDKNRTDSYTEDGTSSKPYKTIVAAVAYVASLAYNGYINIEINNGIYNENIILEDTDLKYLVFTGNGYVSINPSTGNALQSTSNNDNLYALHIENIIFSKPIVITGSNGTTAFSDVILNNVMFNGTGTITATCINNITIKEAYSECDIVLNNVSYCYSESSQLQGNLSISNDDTSDVPSGGGNYTMIANGVYLSGTPSYSVSGTSTIVCAIVGSRWGASGSITLPANVTLYVYNSFLRGTTTNNGSIYLRGGSTLEGYVAGTGSLTLTGNDCKYYYYDNSTSGLVSSTVQTAIDETFSKMKYATNVLYVDNKRTDTYTEIGTYNLPYKTIMAAMDSITDNSSTNRFCIKIATGAAYTEALAINKDFVTLEGYGETILSGEITLTSPHFRLEHLKINSVVNGTYTSGFLAEISDCSVNIGKWTVTGAGTGDEWIQITGGATLWTSDIELTGITGVVSCQSGYFEGTHIFTNCYMEIIGFENYNGEITLGAGTEVHIGGSLCIGTVINLETDAIAYIDATTASGITLNDNGGTLHLTTQLGNLSATVGGDATGDIYYRNSSGLLARLGIETEGKALLSTGTVPNWGNIDKILFNQTSDKTNVCDGTAQSLIGSGVGSVIIPANSLNIGDSISLTSSGIVTASSGDSITLTIKLNEVEVYTHTENAGVTFNDTPYFTSGCMVVRNIGETGSIKACGVRQIFAALGFGTATSLPINSLATVDTTVDNTISIEYTAPVGASITNQMLEISRKVI